jgi:tRNA threonylcarbamoyladenosine biosynthesis protein TsaE
MKIILNNLSATKKIATKIADVIIPHKFIIGLSGDLGAGKTTLVREILHSMGVTDRVKSPTFTYVEPYSIFYDNDKYKQNIKIYHFDLYRFNDVEDWFNLGFDEYFMEPSICFIEWYENANGLLPNIDWKINLVQLGYNKRELEIISTSIIGNNMLKLLHDLLNNFKLMSTS